LDFAAVLLGIAEHDGPAARLAGIGHHDVPQRRDSVFEVALDRQVLHVQICLVLTLFEHVDENSVLGDKLPLDLLHPIRIRCTEHNLLNCSLVLFLDVTVDLLHIFLETHVEHRVRLVQNYRLQVFK